MATYCDEPVDNYFYSSYNPYIERYHRPKNAGWRYKTYLSGGGDASEAFSNQQRAQLKSILSQINPKLTPRLRKANTKDVAVQVNPRRDASVQCAIGPRTLLAMKRDFRRRSARDGGQPGGSGGDSPGSGVRYPRTLAVYSPVAFRSVTTFLVDENNNKKKKEGEQEEEGEEAEEPPADPPAPAVSGEKSKDNQAEKCVKLPEETRKNKSRQQGSKSVQQTVGGSKVKAPVRFQVSRASRDRGGASRPSSFVMDLFFNVFLTVRLSDSSWNRSMDIITAKNAI